MNSYRTITILVCCLAVIYPTSAFRLFGAQEEEAKDESPKRPAPLSFGIFSKPSHPGSEQQTGFGLGSHIGNVLNGGSIGFQFQSNPAEKIHHAVDFAKQFIPKAPGGIFQRPQGPKPHAAKPKPPKSDETWESEKEKPEWEPENPEKPQNEGPKWEDIGESPDYVTVPIEDIIQPRIRPRPKRFIESKIYHVPLLFRSNAKPFQVKIKGPNQLEKTEDSNINIS